MTHEVTVTLRDGSSVRARTELPSDRPSSDLPGRDLFSRLVEKASPGIWFLRSAEGGLLAVVVPHFRGDGTEDREAGRVIPIDAVMTIDVKPSGPLGT